MGMTYVQKVLAKACDKSSVAVGSVLESQLHFVHHAGLNKIILWIFLDITV